MHAIKQENSASEKPRTTLFFFSEPREKARISPTLFGYLGIRYLFFLGCCILAFSSLFLIAELLEEMRDFLDAEASLTQIATYFLLSQSRHLPQVLPMALLLSVSYVLNQLARNHEITAVRASGISIFQFCLPVWLIAIATGALLFWFHESVAPEHTRQAQQLRQRILNGQENRTQEQDQFRLAFRNHHENRFWFFENFDREDEQKGVSVKQFTPESSLLKWEIRAQKAVHQGGQWIFHNGFRFEYEPEDNLPVKSVAFDRLQINQLDETPQHIFYRLKPAEAMNLSEIIVFLRTETGAAPSTRRIFRSLAWHRSTLPLSCVMAALLGVGMSAGKGRGSPLRGFAAAIGLMVLYYILNQSFLVLGKYNILPPPIAGAMPTLGFSLTGIWLVYRQR